jgi:hypothetical protein
MLTSRKYKGVVLIFLLLLGMSMTECPAEAGIFSWTLKGLWKAGRTAGSVLDDAARWSARGYHSIKGWIWADDASKTAIKAVSKASKLARVVDALTDAQIDELAKLSVPEAGKILGKMRLSVNTLADTYLRILVRQGKISMSYADELWKNLKNVDGFVATMKKISSVNPAQQMGHLFEIDLANQAVKKGFTVIEIGKKFRDPRKSGLTDLDILIEKAGKKFFIEAKNYFDVPGSSRILDIFRADMDSLVAARELFGDGKLYFVISNKPSDAGILKLLQTAAQKRGVELLFGNAEEIAKAIS